MITSRFVLKQITHSRLGTFPHPETPPTFHHHDRRTTIMASFGSSIPELFGKCPFQCGGSSNNLLLPSFGAQGSVLTNQEEHHRRETTSEADSTNRKL